MVIVCHAYFKERDVQIPGRIAAKTCGAMAEDTAKLVMEVGFRVGSIGNAAKILCVTKLVSVILALLGTNPVLQIRLAAKVSCVTIRPTASVIPAWQ